MNKPFQKQNSNQPFKLNSMNTRTFNRIGIILICTSLLFSCKKDEETTTPAPTNKDKLVGKNWTLSAYSIEPAIDIDGNGTQENNLMPFLQACNLDDFYDLNSDNTYTAEEGASKCDPNDPQVFETGTWAFSSDGTLVIFSPNGGASYEQSIESLSTSVWEATRTVVQNGVTYTQSLTYD